MAPTCSLALINVSELPNAKYSFTHIIFCMSFSIHDKFIKVGEMHNPSVGLHVHSLFHAIILCLEIVHLILTLFALSSLDLQTNTLMKLL